MGCQPPVLKRPASVPNVVVEAGQADDRAGDARVQECLGDSRQGVARTTGSGDALRFAEQPLGERLGRIDKREAPRRTPRRCDCLPLRRPSGTHRSLAQGVRPDPAAHLAGLPPTSPCWTNIGTDTHIWGATRVITCRTLTGHARYTTAPTPEEECSSSCGTYPEVFS